MGTVDYRGRFLDVDMRYPGPTSDSLVFAAYNLKGNLETYGFLAPGLVLFGDNVYSNSAYMVTPYKSAQGIEDDFNFYQSQIRINVKCAFEKLVHRWGYSGGLYLLELGLIECLLLSWPYADYTTFASICRTLQ